MRKNLLLFNRKLYALAFVVTVFYMGIDFGSHAQIRAELYGTDWIPDLKGYILYFVIAFALLGMIAHFLHKNYIHVSAKSCFCMAVLTPISVLPYWIIVLISDLQYTREGYYAPHRWFYLLKVIVFPSVLFVISLIICINYIICAIQIRKENKALGLNG